MVGGHTSQGSPVSRQKAPSVLGLTSPRLDCANAATNGEDPASHRPHTVFLAVSRER